MGVGVGAGTGVEFVGDGGDGSGVVGVTVPPQAVSRDSAARRGKANFIGWFGKGHPYCAHKKSPLRCSTRGHGGDPSLVGALPGRFLPGSQLGSVVTALRPTGLFVDNPGAASLGLHRTGRARFVTSPLPFANVGGGVPISCPPPLYSATLDCTFQVVLKNFFKKSVTRHWHTFTSCFVGCF